MTEPMDHATCSELLARYVRGELDEPSGRAVREHLAGCAECEQERRGLTALLAGAPPSLTGDERDALLEGVWDAVGRRPEPTPASPPRSRRGRGWFERISPALAAAALVLVVVGVSSLMEGSGDEGGAGGTGAPERAKRNNGAPIEGGVGGARFEPAEGAFTADTLTRLARTPSVRAVAGAGPASSGALLEAIAAQAPSPVARQLRQCGDATLQAADDPVLPALAQRGTFEGKRVLVLVLVTDRDPGGRLDGYSIRVWPEGRCDLPVHAASGPLPSR